MKGQVALGLVILSVVAIVSIIGLALLFSRASDVAGGNQSIQGDTAIGWSYSRDPGISSIYQLPRDVSYASAYTSDIYTTKGHRTPAFIASSPPNSNQGLQQLSACEDEIGHALGITTVSQKFSCYATLLPRGPNYSLDFYCYYNGGDESAENTVRSNLLSMAGRPSAFNWVV